MKLDETVRAELDQTVLCWLATVGADGTPNVSPKEVFAAHGEDALVIAEIASPLSLRNVRANPKVCVSFIDVFRQRGFKVIGEAGIVASDDPAFPGLAVDLLAKAGGVFEVRHVIHVRIAHISRIWAPSYRLFPDRPEVERMEDAYRTYGVQAIPR